MTKLRHFLGKDKFFDVMNYVILSLILFIALYPLYFVVIASISNPVDVNRGDIILFPSGFNIQGYKIVLRDQRILMGYYNSVIYTVFGTIFSVFITVCAAFPLSRKDLYGKKVATWFFLFTMYFGGGLIPTYIQVKKLGLVGSRLAIILVGSLSVYNMLVCRSYFQSNIPEELGEAAKIDGCSVFRFFMKIVMPNSKAIVAIMTLYYAVAQWNDYFHALIYLNDSKKYSLQIIVRNILLASQSMDVDADPELLMEMTHQADVLKYAMIIVTSLPVLIIYPFIQKHFVKGVMVGSVKG